MPAYFVFNGTANSKHIVLKCNTIDMLHVNDLILTMPYFHVSFSEFLERR